MKMETIAVGAVAAASAASAGVGVASASFLAGVGATIMGNLIFILLFLFVCGLFSYDSNDDMFGWAAFWGLVVALVVGLTQAPMMLVWYLVGSLVVMAIQLTWFDMRSIERKKATMNPNCEYWAYRWFTYKVDIQKKVHLVLDRGSMGRYGVGYVAIAPFLVVHWVFGELIRSVVEVFIDAVRNSLTRRLSKIFDSVDNTVD
jgi:hypothetical protein